MSQVKYRHYHVREGGRRIAMKRLLWSRLPKELIEEEVLTRLPWQDVIRFRTVSKYWNKLLQSVRFRLGWKKDSSDIPLCFTSCPLQGNSFYNPATDSWNKSSVFAVYEKRLIECTGLLNITFSVIGAAEGLLLLQVFNEDEDVENQLEDNVIVLVNPLDPHTMRKVILLPVLKSSATSRVIGMVWNAASSSHRLLALRFDNSRMLRFYCYDVKTFIWERIASWPEKKYRYFESPSMAKDPSHGGRISCLGTRCLPSPYHRNCFLNYYYVYHNDESHGQSWFAGKQGDPFPYPMDFANLFHRGGNRHSPRGSAGLVGGVLGNLRSTTDAIVVTSIRVWECPLEEGNGDPASEWVEVDAMPDNMLLHLQDRVPCRRFRGAVEGRFICVANSSNNVVMHDMETGSWWKLPTYPVDYDYAFLNSPDVYGRHSDDPYLFMCAPRLDVVLD